MSDEPLWEVWLAELVIDGKVTARTLVTSRDQAHEAATANWRVLRYVRAIGPLAERDGPRFVHDHDECVWLGQQGEEDVYFCEQGPPLPGGRIPTLIFRWGDDGPEYRSGWVLRRELSPELAAKLKEVHPE